MTESNRIARCLLVSVAAIAFLVVALPARGVEVDFIERVISTSAYGAESVYATDMDGDGDTDVLSASTYDDKIAWYESDGGSPPSFTERVISITADGAHSVFATDVDGDGDTDVLSASYQDNKIAWYESDGGSPPTFTERVIWTAAYGATSVFATDVDGDGDTDVLSASEADDTIAWYESDGGSPPTFTERLISTVRDGPQSVFATDLDGDGDTDVLSASYWDNRITWYENDGGLPPTFTERLITPIATGAISVFATDVDGDGDTDVLSASHIDDTIAWYESDGGSPTGFTERHISTNADEADSVFAADVDGDGDIDVLSASGWNDHIKIAWYESDGGSPPFFFAEWVISTTADGVHSVYATDMDGDGDTDILSASTYDDTIAWYENTMWMCGNGVDDPGEECDDGGESATCDTDCTFVECGDGTLNVTAGEECDDGNTVPGDGCDENCLLQGACCSSEGNCSPTTQDVCEDVLLGNYAGDGTACNPEQDCNANGTQDICDIAEGTSQDCNANTILDECDIIDGTSEDCNSNGVPDECEPDEDCNGNGIQDICDIADGTSQDCNANGIPDECEVAPVIFAGFEEPVDYGVPHIRYFVGADDLNGDGSVDLFSTNSSYSSVSVLLNNGDGTFAPGMEYDARSGPHGAASGDLDGDFDNDLVVVNRHDGDISVLMNNGDGTFAPQVVYAVADPGSLWYMTIADFNDDEDLDLAVANSDAGCISVLLNDGDGTFAPAIDWPSEGGPKDVTARALTADGTEVELDVNSDGHADLAVAQDGCPNISVLINNGDGTFAPWVSYYLGRSSSCVVAGDIDADGDHDLAAATSYNAAVFLNNGDGTFAPMVEYGSGVNYVVFGDVDGDGMLDLTIGEYGSGDVSVLLNNGDGTFADPMQVPIGEGEGPSWITAARLDNDAFLDLVVARYLDAVTVLLNASWAEQDCNGNGIPDTCDIADGTSQDCNESGVPDECIELETDCNDNGAPDECDLADGTSADCNGNALPDECELVGAFLPVVDGLTLWLRAESVTGVAHGEPVETWIDESENSFNLSAGSPSERPLFISAALNGLPVLRFEIDDYFEDYSVWGSSLTSPDETTVFTVMMQDGSHDGNGLMGWGPWGNRFIVLKAEVDTIELQHGDQDGGGRVVWTQPSGWDDNYHYVQLLRDGSLGQCWVDGVLLSPSPPYDTFTDTLDVENNHRLEVGGGFGELDEKYQGDIAEILVYDHALSSTERQAVQLYLATKYFGSGYVNDCDGNGILDECEPDCNGNGIADECDTEYMISEDCNNDGIPDECIELENDCNGNSIPDECDITDCPPDTPACADCNVNSVPDACDFAEGTSVDCQPDGIPDECQLSDSGLYQHDDGSTEGSVGGAIVGELCWIHHFTAELHLEQIVAVQTSIGSPANPDNSGVSPGDTVRVYVWSDPNGDGNPSDASLLSEASALAAAESIDADMPQSIAVGPVTLAIGQSFFIGASVVIDARSPAPMDEDEPLAHRSWLNYTTAPYDPIDWANLMFMDDVGISGNWLLRAVGEVAPGAPPTNDCNENGVPDECDIADSISQDCNANGIPDECDPDCNANAIPDDCDIADGTSADCNGNGIPDECEEDCNANGTPDSCDIATGTSEDCESNGIPDECDIADCPPGVPSCGDCNGNGIPDVCDLVGCGDGTCGADEDCATCPADCGSCLPCDPPPGAPENDCCGLAIVIAEGDTAYSTVNAGTDGQAHEECEFDGQTYNDVWYNYTPSCDGDMTVSTCDQADYDTDLVVYDGCNCAVMTLLACNDDGQGCGNYTSEVTGPVVSGACYKIRVGGWNEGYMGTGTLSVTTQCGRGSRVDPRGAPSQDCNGNGVPDECDVASGTSMDANGNGIPDECETDCNGNGILDTCDLDCDAIGGGCNVPECGLSEDCNGNGLPDECEPGGAEDCNANGAPDLCDIFAGAALDCNDNAAPDECDIADGTSQDCNINDIPDECDITDGTSEDCNSNTTPDECDLADGTSQDCNGNEAPDECDIAGGSSEDCNDNDVPDECDVAGGTSLDCNGNGTPDECELVDNDCNGSGIPDDCDIDGGSLDCNLNGIPDECDVVLHYSTDFESGVGSEWASSEMDNSVPDPFTSFSGRFGNYPQILTLDVPPDVPCAVVFDLCIIDSWDGNDPSGGADYFIVQIDGLEMFRETFHMEGPGPDQSFPGAPDIGPDDYGWGGYFDSIYQNVTVPFTAGGTGLQITFLGEGLQGLSDESWGLDNVRVVLYDCYDPFSPGGCEWDCNGNGMPDGCEAQEDCNDNGAQDICDIAAGMSEDCHVDGIPDECQLVDNDCQPNQVPDDCEDDCNANGLADECDITGGTSDDCNMNGVPDECDGDCNGNGTPDDCDIASGTSEDCQPDGVPDECDIVGQDFGLAPAVGYDVDRDPRSIATGDFDADGDLDVAVAIDYLASSHVSVLLNNGDGSFGGAIDFPTGCSAWGVEAAYLDDDPYLDLVTANRCASGGVTIHLNNGTDPSGVWLGFGAPVSYAAGQASAAVIAGDLDEDGDLDLIVANSGNTSDIVSVLLNNGNGTFGNAIDVVVGYTPLSVAAADLNQNGRLDVGVATWGSGNISVLLNNGVDKSGVWLGFVAAVEYEIGLGEVRSVVAADFNDDGYSDFAVSFFFDSWEDGYASVLLNNGDGSFALPVSFAVGWAPFSVAAADLNLDGHIDLSVANTGMGDVVSVLLNEGNDATDNWLGFAPALEVSVGWTPGFVTAADLDDDGDLDLATASEFDDNVAVVLNVSTYPSSEDCNGSGTPDECDIAEGISEDCNENGTPDECDIAGAASTDVNEDGVPDECQADIRVVPVAVLIDPAGTSEVRTTLPESITGVVRSGTYYVEIWVSDLGDTNTGLSGVYVDVALCDETSAIELFHGTIFNTFESGTIVEGGVDEFGGSALPHGGGIEPEWVRIGWIKMRGDVEAESCTVSLAPSTSGVAAFDRGLIPWPFVNLGSIDLQITPASVTYDLDVDGFIGVGDLSLFAGSWQQPVPPGAEEHDFDCDDFVGVGDLSWFATGWMKYVDDPTILYPPCPGGRGGRGGVIDVDFRLFVLDVPSGLDVTTTLPTSIGSIILGQTYYLEIWVSDAGDINTGLVSAYVDVTFPANAASVVSISHGGLFTLFPTGSSVTGGIDELGGSILPGGVGIEPEWACVAVVEMLADAAPPSVIFELLPSLTGVGALGRGVIPWSNMSLDSVLIGQGEVCAGDEQCDDGDACTGDTCDPASPQAGGDGCVHEYRQRLFGDIVPPFCPPVENCPQPTLDDITCLLNDFADGPTVSGCGTNDPPDSTDLAPCGGDSVLDLDDILAVLDSFAQSFPCQHPCP